MVRVCLRQGGLETRPYVAENDARSGSRSKGLQRIVSTPLDMIDRFQLSPTDARDAESLLNCVSRDRDGARGLPRAAWQ